MLNQYYIILGILISAYVGVLFLLNRIPHFRVKSLGWFALKHVTIELKHTHIYIRKVQLRINLFRNKEEKESALKLFNIELIDIDVKSLKAESPKPDDDKIVHDSINNTDGLNSQKPHKKPFDLQRVLSFKLPKWIFDIMVQARIMNQINIHMFRCSYYDEDVHDQFSVFLDYTRIESAMDHNRVAKFTITLFNGYLQNDAATEEEEHQVRLFRNIELLVLNDSITQCKVGEQNHIYLQLSNFRVSLSIARMSIPLHTLLKSMSSVPSEDTGVASDITNEEKLGEEKLQKSLKKHIGLVNTALEVFTKVEIKLEEFGIHYESISVTASNFVTSLTSAENEESQRLAKLELYMTSAKVFHKESKSFELPSGTFRITANPIELIRVADSLVNNVEDKESFINLDTAMMLTNPIIDIYYDQSEYFFSLPTNKERSSNKSKPIQDNSKLFQILYKLREFSNRIVILDTKINLHYPDPEMGISNIFHRKSKGNMIINLSLQSFVHRFYTKNFNTLLTTKGKSKKFSISGLFKIKDFRFNAAGNSATWSKVNVLAVYNILENSMSLKVSSKNTVMKSVNEAIFHLVREIRNRKIVHFNKRYNELRNTSCVDTPAHSTPVTESDLNELYLQLFEIVPPFISTIKISLSNIMADIVCKDGLPSHIMYDEKLQEEIDLADFKRGVAVKLNDIKFVYRKPKEEIDLSIKSLQMFTLSEHSTEYIDDFDQVTSVQEHDSDFTDLSSLNSDSSSNSSDSSGDEISRRIKKVLGIRDISLNNKCREAETRDINRLHLNIPEVDGRIDIFFVWCTIYAKTLVTYFAPTVARNCSKAEMNRMGGGGSKKVKLDINIESIAVVCRLPNNVDIMFEFDSLRMKNALVSQQIDLQYVRLYVVHPATKLWARLLVIREPVIKIGNAGHLNLSISVDTSAVRLNIPHQFLFYTVIDNILTFAKAIKQAKHNFENISLSIDEFDRLMPKAVKGLVFPYVNIKTKIFGLTIESDPFENELAYIYEIGLIEQRERMKKMAAFEKHAEELREQAVPDLEDKIKLSETSPSKPKLAVNTSAPKFNSPLSKFFCHRCGMSHTHGPHHDHSHSNTGDETPVSNKKQQARDEVSEDTLFVMTVSETEEKIRIARDNLEQSFGSSWINKYKLFRAVKTQSWTKRCHRAWGDDAVKPLISEKFDILNYSAGPHAFGGVFKDLDLVLDSARIPNVDDFLYEFGKNQPKLEYSILIPLFLQIKSKSLYVFLRDYPLPLLSFPENHDGSRPTINITANLVINEKLVKRKEEMRFIFVPFSPAAPSSDKAIDNFYSVYIPRTLTPVKFMIDLQCDLAADRACMLTWCKSYQAGMGAASAAFDNFTKPNVDDSPIGWWDKISLLLHGRFRFTIANELCLHIKSSANPYELVGKAAGFVFCWKNNVSLRINDSPSTKELIVLESDDFLLAIPNYSSHEKKSWSLFYDEMEEYIPDIDSESKKFNKRVMKLSSADKVRWVLGMTFERNKDESATSYSDEQERISTFKPHYDVIVTNPAFEWHPDSYKGYRSDYIHMAISVTSKSSTGNCYNAAYLSPLTFHYFFNWWSTLKDSISLPVKSGRLFKKSTVDPSHVKMGAHLFTIKYQLVFDPLTISHMYMHSIMDSKHKNKIAFTGLKAKFAKCSIDLHQTKEYVTYVNKKLGINNKVQHLKMNQSEIQVDEADVRFVNAVFVDTSMFGHLERYLKGNHELESSFSATSPSTKFSDVTQNFKGWLENVDVFDDDFSWVDPDDFVELEVREPLSPYPKIKVDPFFFTPKLSYIREFSLTKSGPYPFGNEDSHDCLMGIEKPDETQGSLLKERRRVITQELKLNEELLQRLEASDKKELSKDIDRVKLDIQVQKEKLDVVEAVWESFTGGSISALSTRVEDGESLQKTASRALSVYSSHRSAEEIKEAHLLNTSVVEFHNRFIVHNLQLKWNNSIRDLFMDYIRMVSDRKSNVYFMSKKAVDLVESVINENLDIEDHIDIQEKVFNKEFKRGEDVINGFNDEIDEVDSDEQEAEKKYLIKLIHPQIQLVSDKSLDSCVLITSKDLEMRILGVNLKGTKQLIGESGELANLIETRYGVLFNDSHMFVFNKDESTIADSDFHYGSDAASKSINWPPWLESEVCYDSSWVKDQLIVERNSMAFIFKKPNFLFSEKKEVTQDTELIIQLAKIVINANSDQYSTMYYVITDLLIHSKSKEDERISRLNKIVSLSDSSDFIGLDIRITDLQYTIREYSEILLKFDQKGTNLNPTEKEHLHTLELELEKSKFELKVLMKGLRLRSSKSKSHRQNSKFWNILADQVIWHLLDDNREPFIDLAIAGARFTRIDASDGSNLNKLEITMIQGFNLQSKAVYPELLRPYLEGKDMNAPEMEDHGTTCAQQAPIIKITWKILEPVGGIPIMQHAKFAIQPLKVELDYDTAKQIFAYMFPEDNSEDVENSLRSEFADENDESEVSSISEVQVSNSSSSHTTLSKNPIRNFIQKRRTSSRFGSKADLNSDSNGDSEQSSISHRYSESSSKRSSMEDVSVFSGSREVKEPKARLLKKNVHKISEDEDEISVIMRRSSKYISIIDIEVSKFKLFVSFKAPKHLNILDVHELLLNIPTLHYGNKVWSGEEFILRVRKDIIKIILNHTGKILGNKFKIRKRKGIAEPLNQISDYASFMTIKDLQSAGRSRDTPKTTNGEHPHPHAHHHHHQHNLKRSYSDNAYAFERLLQDIEDEYEEDAQNSSGN
ncbi:mitochondrial protein from FMP27-domain-containing protein [Scheffersomyces xylosifermentans]|uniref:mitochondrial protein from FMP27-domain-containing protein n=1 Tax=Scheffersomyces xylosifermentans TaxID=1304137 RepID=UPI00315C8282